MAALTVHQLDIAAQGLWGFGSDRPRWAHPVFGHSGEFDPFPAYTHDMAVVAETAAHVEKACPPLWDVQLHVANREEIGRSNGYSNVRQHGHYVGEEWVKDPPVGLIVFSGKRIPPHPALTRYLVAHEYGHNVEWMLEHLAGSRQIQDTTVVTGYAELRGLPTPVHHGNGGRWHDAAAEVFACDFRTIVCGVETDYWPHPGIPRPHEVPADLAAWWADALNRLTADAVS